SPPSSLSPCLQPPAPTSFPYTTLFRSLNRDRGRTIVMVLHDLNLAARYADHLVVMRDGTVRAIGDPRTVLTEDLVAEAFGLRARVVPDPVCGAPMVVPVGRFHGTPAPD